MKKKRKPGKAQDSLLEAILRFEIIVVLFALIGFYYFLSFSPIRMPKEPIASLPAALALLPPPSASIPQGQKDGGKQDSSLSVAASTLAAADQLSLTADSGANASPVVAGIPPAVSENHVLKSASETAPESPPVDDPQKIEPQALGLSQTEKKAPPATFTEKSPRQSPIRDIPVEEVEDEVVVAGSYVLQADAVKARSQLESLGLSVKSEVRKIPTPMYRVYLGPFASRNEIRKMMNLVRKMGDQPFIKKDEAGSLVVIASFYLESSVVAWENMYHDAGLSPKVRQESLLIPQTFLFVEGYQVNENPEALLARVRAAGFKDANLKKTSQQK